MFLEKRFSRDPQKVKKWHEIITQYLPVILQSYKPGLMIYLFKVAYLKLLTSYEFANFVATNRPKNLKLSTKK